MPQFKLITPTEEPIIVKGDFLPPKDGYLYFMNKTYRVLRIEYRTVFVDDRINYTVYYEVQAWVYLYEAAGAPNEDAE